MGCLQLSNLFRDRDIYMNKESKDEVKLGGLLPIDFCRSSRCSDSASRVFGGSRLKRFWRQRSAVFILHVSAYLQTHINTGSHSVHEIRASNSYKVIGYGLMAGIVGEYGMVWGRSCSRWVSDRFGVC
jgi:hypothetical protein